jgi:hypothetical protein
MPQSQAFQTKSRDDLEREGTHYEDIGGRAPDNAPGIEFFAPAGNCRNARVNCCGTFFNICMVPGVWYCCRNGNCKTCYKI